MRLRAFLLLVGLSCCASAGKADVVLGFSPPTKDLASAESVVLGAIQAAKKSIHLAAYSFTSKPIAEALVAAHKRGVEVRAVLDKSNGPKTGRYSGARFLANMGVPTRINSQYAIMHNKFMVIDGVSVQTGSFNYTAAAANRNAENVLLVRDVPALAADYDKEWRRLWEESEPLAGNY